MWQRRLHQLYGPAAYAYAMSRVHSTGRLPLPGDSPIVHASGPDPDRIVLYGGWAVRGLGVASYELGLAGLLARRLAAATGHGADVDARGFSEFTASRCIEKLGEAHLGRFDAVVLQVGAHELLAQRPIAAWRRDITEVIEAAVAAAPTGTPIVVLGNLPLPEVMSVPRFVERSLERRRHLMNVETERACAAVPSVWFAEIFKDTTGTHIGRNTTEVYRDWSLDIVPTLTRAMEAAAPDRALDVIERDRQRSLDDLRLTRDPDVRVDRIVRMARDAFGVTAASLTVIDGDEQWIKSAAGMDNAVTPRVDAICNRTIEQPGAYVIEDMAADPSFADYPWAGSDDAPGFYAGYPLEAPDGHRIGALCVLDDDPRAFSRDDVSMLRDLALRAQSVLWDEMAR